MNIKINNTLNKDTLIKEFRFRIKILNTISDIYIYKDFYNDLFDWMENKFPEILEGTYIAFRKISGVGYKGPYANSNLSRAAEAYGSLIYDVGDMFIQERENKEYEKLLLELNQFKDIKETVSSYFYYLSNLFFDFYICKDQKLIEVIRKISSPVFDLDQKGMKLLNKYIINKMTFNHNTKNNTFGFGKENCFGYIYYDPTKASGTKTLPILLDIASSNNGNIDLKNIKKFIPSFERNDFYRYSIYLQKIFSDPKRTEKLKVIVIAIRNLYNYRKENPIITIQCFNKKIMDLKK